MVDLLFEFDEGKMPTPVFLATAALVALFAIGIPVRILLTLL
ncbi:hypothetical protein [Natronolimnobius baerhuensis]|nr:hypothetical protein [Natronolimnobius baerhuensis]